MELCSAVAWIRGHPDADPLAIEHELMRRADELEEPHPRLAPPARPTRVRRKRRSVPATPRAVPATMSERIRWLTEHREMWEPFPAPAPGQDRVPWVRDLIDAMTESGLYALEAGTQVYGTLVHRLLPRARRHLTREVEMVGGGGR